MADNNNSTDHDYESVLREKLLDELQAIREYVEDIPDIKARVTNIEERVTNIEGDVADIKADLSAVKDILRDHGSDIANLKRKVA